MLSRDDKATLQLVGKLLAADARVRTGKEQAWINRNRNKTATVETVEQVGLSDEQQACLLDFLKRKFPKEINLRITGIKPLVGGFSKQTLFIDLADTVDLPTSVVVRRDSPYFSGGTSVVIEYPVLVTMYPAGVAVPRPYAIDAKGEVLGTPFIVVGRYEGRNIGDFLKAEPNRAVAIDIAKKLARLHRAPFDPLESVLEGGGLDVKTFMLQQMDKFAAMWNRIQNEEAYVMQAAIDWLRKNIDLADGPRAVVHRDVGLHNLLVHNDEMTVLLDWESVVISTPAEDIAYLRYIIPQMMDWDEFVSTYETAAGVKLTKHHLDYYIICSLVRCVVGIYALADPALGGERANLQIYYLGSCFGQTVLERLSAKLAEVLA